MKTNNASCFTNHVRLLYVAKSFYVHIGQDGDGFSFICGGIQTYTSEIKTTDKGAVQGLLPCMLPGGGGGGNRQSFIRGGSAQRSKPLSFYIPFLREKISLSYTFCRPTERVLLNFSLEKTLKILE